MLLMKIPFYNFKDLHTRSLKEKIIAHWEKIVEDNSYMEGELNHQFEKEFAATLGAKHCLLVGNGTDALELSLKAYGIGPGDNVGVPGITFLATAEAVMNVGATPIFIDVREEDALMCPSSLKRMVQQYSLRAVIPVHIYGLPCPMKEIQDVCDEFNVAIVEDAAQAHGALLEDSLEKVGSTPNLITFSFYPTKNLGAFGDAGAILTQSDFLAQKIKTLRNHGRGGVGIVGRNSRCDHLQAAVLHSKMETFEEDLAIRRRLASFYQKTLQSAPYLKCWPNKYLSLSSFHLFPILLESQNIRQKLGEYLAEKGIGTAPFYLKSLAQEDAFSHCQGECHNANKMAGRIICLPLNPTLDETQLKTVTDEIQRFFADEKKEWGEAPSPTIP
jgi:dTDP-4-amino-4,6-dideoxygalactose transaminase